VYNSRKVRKVFVEQESKIYFEGVVFETLPGAKFRVKVKRPSRVPASEVTYFYIVAKLKAALVRKLKIIKGDYVKVEVIPEDMYFNQDQGILKGTVVERKI
jgi:translation initiation factor IF-1